MAERFVNIDREPPMLLPPDLRDWVAENDLARLILECVELCDLSGAQTNVRGSGSAQYPPGMMLALLIGSGSVPLLVRAFGPRGAFAVAGAFLPVLALAGWRPALGGEAAQDRVGDPDQLAAMLEARRGAIEARIRGELFDAHRAADHGQVPIGLQHDQMGPATVLRAI